MPVAGREPVELFGQGKVEAQKKCAECCRSYQEQEIQV